MPALMDGVRVYVCDLIMCVQRAISVHETEAAHGSLLIPALYEKAQAPE